MILIILLLLLVGCSSYGQTANGASAELAITNLGAGMYSLNGQGIVGYTYSIQATDDLGQTNWQTLGAAQTNATGGFMFMINAGGTQRFYRAVAAPVLTAAARFSPNSIPGLAYYWNFNDVPLGGGATNWADRIQGLKWLKASGATVPTNSGYGILFQNPTDRITNSGATVSRPFSIWYVCDIQVEPGANPASLLDDYTTYNGLLLQFGQVQGNWSGTANVSTTSLTNNVLYNIVDSQGAIWTNAISTGSSVSQPAGNFTFNSLANDAGGGDNLFGTVKYVGMWTNYALTGADITNLYEWTQTNGVTNVTAGLVAWWKLDEGSGTTTADASGNGHTGTLINNPSWTAGQIGDALTFNGVNTGGSFSNTDLVADNLANFSVSLWWKTTSTVTGLQQLLLDKLASDDDAGWYVQMESPGRVEFLIGDHPNNWLEAYGIQNLNDGNWHHLVGCKTAGNTNLWEYIDGLLQPGLSTSSPGVTVGSFANTNNVHIGYDDQNVHGYFDGSIDDVRVYNRILSASEVDLLYRWRGQP